MTPIELARPAPTAPSRIIAVLGAESTGKTTLAQALTAQLLAQGRDAVMVPELLRHFCEEQGRTPRADEQAQLAVAQTAAIAQAASVHAWVVADTTSLMTAVYSEIVFGDRGLYPMALAAHAQTSLTLLTALDVPWVADGLQRDGPHVREPVDGLVRQALTQAQLPYVCIGGLGNARVQQAWSAIEHHWRERSEDDTSRPRWRWVCDKCDDGDCEQHLLPTLLQPAR